MKVILTIELDYDESSMHGENKGDFDWFINDVLKGNNLELFDNNIGDVVGTVKTLSVDDIK